MKSSASESKPLQSRSKVEISGQAKREERLEQTLWCCLLLFTSVFFLGGGGGGRLFEAGRLLTFPTYRRVGAYSKLGA